MQAVLMPYKVHRIHKDRPNNIIVLDAVADEINNSILRAGHVTFGLSASLNGSGTAIDFNWLKENIRKLSDEDDEKTIESLLLRERIYVAPLHQAGTRRYNGKSTLPETCTVNRIISSNG